MSKAIHENNALTRQRRLRPHLLLACLASTAIGLGIVVAIRSEQPASPAAVAFDYTVVAVHISRDPGLLVVPQIDQTITNRDVAATLAGDIEGLPAFPPGFISCPVDFGTRYILTFSTVTGQIWSARVSAQGCRGVKLSDGRTLWALPATKLFADLGTALRLAPDEVVPRPCSGAAPGSICYPQPTMPSS